jgi:hypothetical protein
MMSRSLLPLALITIGVVFLLGNLLPGQGRAGLILLGLGAAFAIGRVTTGRYGYSVPAGLLVAIGTYVSIQEILGRATFQGGSWFFVLLGAGFVLAYFVGMRPQAVWPLFPGTILICLGLLLFGVSALSPLASLAWIVSYWPVALVVVGAWLLFHQQVPRPLRAPIATLGGIALLAYGVMAALASVAAGGAFAQPGFGFNFGVAAFKDEITLDQPIASGGVFRVNNTSGRTTVHGGSGSGVHVVATRHFAVEGQPPPVNMSTTSDGSLSLSLDNSGQPQSWADYTVDVPAGVQVIAQASSGQLEIDDVSGPVQADSNSGSIQLDNLGGDLKASASSGRIRGTRLLHVRDVQTSSGSINLQGTFTDAAQIRASSGSVQLTFSPDSAVQMDVRTGSGSINNHGLNLSTQHQEHSQLQATLRSPASGALLSIQTSSGSVSLGQ